MAKYELIQTPLKDLLLLKPRVFPDERGYFFEVYAERDIRALGIETPFVQDNLSRSKRGVLRGLHFQTKCPQAKFVGVVRGAIFDVAVDLRRGSPTYGKWHAEILSDENHAFFYLPIGFAHGFLTLSEVADVFYKCSDYYCPEGEGGIVWDDPHLAIKWPIETKPIVSAKDQALSPLAGFDSPFTYQPKIKLSSTPKENKENEE